MHLPVSLQVLTTEGSMATGAFHRELADRSQWDGIIRMSARCIKFWYDMVDQANIKAQFVARDVFPNVFRVIDCTHIKAPSEVEFDFGNRKHSHSINMQIVMQKCD